MEYRVQLSLALFPIHVLVALPHLRLRFLNERYENGHINRLCLVIGRLIALDVSTVLKEIRLYVLLEVDFLGFHIDMGLCLHLFLPCNVFVDYGFLVFLQGVNLGLLEGYESVDFCALVIEEIGY